MSRARDTADQINRVNSSAADATAITVDSSENVGIGTSSPSSYYSTDLVVAVPDEGGITLVNDTTHTSYLMFADGTSGADRYRGQLSYDHNVNGMAFATNGNERMRIDLAGKVGIGDSSPSARLEIGGMAAGEQALLIQSGRNDALSNGLARINITDSNCPFAGLQIDHAGTGAAIIANGNVMVGKTSSSLSNNGTELQANGTSLFTRSVNSGDGAGVAYFQRNTSDGNIIMLYNSSTTHVGSIGNNQRLYMAGTNMGIYFGPSYIAPVNNLGTLSDNQYELGNPSYRWEDAFITNGVTTGSDANDKQDIATLTATEMLVAARLSQTFRTYRWKDKVVEKGDNARTHTGTIAQEVQAAFTAEGLDAGDYAMFMSDTWWEHDVEVPAVEAVAEVTDEDGNITTEAVEAVDAYTRTDNYDTEAEAPEGATSKTRLGIRYPELLSFVAAYNEQRFASIEARLTALEA